MKGDRQIVEQLNKVLVSELTSINHYFLHARMFRNWGLERLNEQGYKKSIKDMKQADDLIERILFLEGLPNLQKLNRLMIGEHTVEMLQCDHDLQLEQIALLKASVDMCEKAQDYVSRDLLVEILEYEEDFLDWVETQQYQVSKMSIENYLQANLKEED